MIGKEVTVVRVRPDLNRTYTVRGVVTDVNKDDAGRVEGVCIHGTRDGGLTTHGWYAMGPNALNGSLVTSQKATVDKCGHAIEQCQCAAI